MAATHTPDRTHNGAGATTADRDHTSRGRRLVTETKAAFKTTEFFAFVAVLIGILAAAAMVDETNAGGFGAQQAWLYATILTVGYMVSRGIAKSGSHQPYDENDS
jgi:hypothetical protein